jgi:5-hydroxyisourate hydrolase-like protein (transthyretin family)
MKVKILFIAIISIMLSCDKETNNPRPIAKGKIIDAVSKQPLANVYVALFKTEGDFFNPTYKLVGEQHTDSQGNFNFNRTDALLIRAKKATYFDSKEYDIQDDVYKQTQTIELVPEAFVNVRLVNKEKKWDKINVYAEIKPGILLNINPGFQSNFDSTFYGLRNYGLNKFLEYRVSKLFGFPAVDSFDNRQIAISLIPHDTVNITINY